MYKKLKLYLHVFFLVSLLTASHVYALVYEENKFIYIPTPMHLPVTYYNINKFQIDYSLSITELQQQELCNVNNCLTEAINAGAVYQKTFEKPGYDELIVYYDQFGDVVGTAADIDEDYIPPPYPEVQANYVPSWPTHQAVTRAANETIVASIPGDFSIGSTGAASYSIPIEIPPGTAGVQPSLMLDYSSQGRAGALGMGWNINGISNLHRCPPILDRDNNVDGIDFNNSDRFCLDGQPLIAVSGAYGADGTEYRTEIDGFSKIISHGVMGNGPAYFEVRTKSGDVMMYGNTLDSFINPPWSNGAIQDTALCWLLSSVTDSVGNFMSFEYDGSKTSGTVMPKSIKYTGHSNGMAPNNEVYFEYESRPDKTKRYIAGRMIQSTQRIKSVVVRRVAGNELSRLNLTYQTNAYTKESQLTKVSKCDPNGDCVPATRFIVSQGGEGGYSTKSGHSGGSVSTLENVQRKKILDLNGDGRADIYYINKSDSTNDYAYLQQPNGTYSSAINTGVKSGSGHKDEYIQFGDFDGDGYLDVLRQNEHTVSATLSANYIYFGRGDGTFGDRTRTPFNFLKDIPCTPIPWNPCNDTKMFGEDRVRVADFDGDGRTDVFYINYNGTSGNHQHTIYRSNGNGTFQGPINTGVSTYFEHSFKDKGVDFSNLPFDRIQMGDFNADGLTDVYYIYGFDGYHQDRVFLNDGDNTFTQQTTGITTVKAEISDQRYNNLYYARYKFSDVNGDGATDIIYQGHGCDCSRTVYTYLSLGNGSFSSAINAGFATIVEDDWEDGTSDYQRLFFGDFNGDGIIDIHYAGTGNGGSNKFYFSEGDGTFFPSGVTAPGLNIGGTEDETTARNLARYQVLDINGDGITDVYNINGSDTAYINTAKRTLLTSVINGLGSSIDISYTTLADATVYKKNQQASSYPNLTVSGPMVVAGATRTSDGIGGYSELFYQYEGARINTRGRGFLGFEKRKAIDKRSDVLVANEYYQLFPLTGQIKATETSTKNVLTSRETNDFKHSFTYQASGGSNQHSYFVYAETSTAESYNYDTRVPTPFSTTTSYSEYDSYGNVTFVRNIIEDVCVISDDANITCNTGAGLNRYFTETTNTYALEDTTRWHLGRLIRAEVQKTLGGELDANGNINGGTVGDLRTSSFEYYDDSDNQAHLIGLLKQEIIEPDSTELKVTTLHEYGPYGNKVKVTTTGIGMTPRISETVYADGRGLFPTSSINALGHTEYYTHGDDWGGRTMLIGPNSLPTVWHYKDFGRLYSEERADGTETIMEYAFCDGACPATVSGVQPFYKRTTRTYGGTPITEFAAPVIEYFDQLNRVVIVQNSIYDATNASRPVYTQTKFDDQGRTIATSLPYENINATENDIIWSKVEYDDLGRVSKEIAPAEGNTTFETTYKYSAFLTTVTSHITIPSAASQTVRQFVNSMDQTLWSQDSGGTDGAPGEKVIFRYDAHGNLEEVEDSAGNITVNDYNLVGHKIYMSDPDMGDPLDGGWVYNYNALGELIYQKDAKQQIVTMEYDVLGRLIKRTENEGVTDWKYDIATTGKGKLACVRHYGSGPLNCDGTDLAGKYEQTLTYDSLGRVATTTTVTEYSPGTYNTHVTATSYDVYGRVDTITYPSNFAVQHQYNSDGYLEKVVNANGTGTVYWQMQAMDELGNITIANYGNGVMGTRTYDDYTGRLDRIETFAFGAAEKVQDLTYKWDTLGNLIERNHASLFTNDPARIETFHYDQLNRLKEVKLNAQTSHSYNYDALGNLTYKSDMGTYTYGTTDPTKHAGPHAVTRVENGSVIKTYDYDNNGNMTQGDGRVITWSSYNKPTLITRNGNQAAFEYGPDRARYKQTSTAGTKTTITTYIGGMYEQRNINNNGTNTQENVHYIQAGGQVIASFTTGGSAPLPQTFATEASQGSLLYLHRDHQGSVDAITDSSGNIVERLSFHAFGERRLANWNSVIGQLVRTSNMTRGYTGHEHLDGVGVIHMNGRIYDAELGRFMSADPFVQQPKNTQSLNRYTYVINNPLTLTDPSGFIFGKLFKGIGKIFKGVVGAIGSALQNPYVRLIASIAIAYFTAGATLNAIVAEGATTITAGQFALAGAVGGFAGGFVGSGGNFEAAIVGGLTGAAAGYIGGHAAFGGFDDLGRALVTPQRVIAHGVVGGAAAEAQGGDFARGFASSALTKSVSGEIRGIADSNPIAGSIAAAVVGGTVSRITGGKFQNAALAAGFQTLYNAYGHDMAKLDQKINSASPYFAHYSDLQQSEIAAAFGDGLITLGKEGVYLLVTGGTTGLVIKFGGRLVKLVPKSTLKPKIGSSGGPGAGKVFPKSIKDKARAESSDTCVFCGVKTTRQPGPTRSEIDHAIPKSRGGNNTLPNAQNTCRTCNRSKGTKTTEEFLNE